MEKVKKVWNWIVWSSENSERISLTLKAGIPTAVLVLGIFGYHVPEMLFSGLLAAILDVLMKVVALAGAFITAYGALRKIYMSF
jgi:hypothetical protein